MADRYAGAGANASAPNRSLKPTGIRVVATVLGLLILLYGYSLFANISYPLFWADESVTAVGAERVLQFGYPKVHDGKNVLYDIKHDDPTLGVDKKTDAYIGGAGWGHYYFAAPFVYLAESFSDIYSKTWLLRVPFAIVGTLGLFLLIMSCVTFLSTTIDKLVFAAAFIFAELACIQLILHLREVRYYSLVIFLSSALIYIFSRYQIQNNLRYIWYNPTMSFLLLGLFVTFSPAYYIFNFTAVMYLVSQHAADYMHVKRQGGDLKRLLAEAVKSVLPFLITIIALTPLFSFFQTFHISSQLSKYNDAIAKIELINIPANSIYFRNFAAVLLYFTKIEVLLFTIGGILFSILFLKELTRRKTHRKQAKFIAFLSLYFVIYLVIICRMPGVLYFRYFISIQPVLVSIMLLNTMVLTSYLRKNTGKHYRFYHWTVIGLTCLGICFTYAKNVDAILGHWYENNHQYKGDLDYVIPYILKNVQNTDKLVVATNYEETSFMYYLKCKAIVGYVKNNLQEDLKYQPDILLYRRLWATPTDNEIFQKLYFSAEYQFIRFPVADYYVNNIPQIYGEMFDIVPNHQFETLATAIEKDQLFISVRKDKAAMFPPPRYDANGHLM